MKLKNQLYYLKEHLNGHKIPTNISLQDNMEIKIAGIVDHHNQEECD